MKEAIFFYDGDCGFCNATVLFLLKRTKPTSLLFSPLQSKYAQNFFAKHEYQQPDFTTAYLFHNGCFYQKSSAILRAIKLAEGLVRYLSICLLIPSFLRDAVYNLVSSMRKQVWLGKKNSCRLLTLQERERFISLY